MKVKSVFALALCVCAAGCVEVLGGASGGQSAPAVVYPERKAPSGNATALSGVRLIKQNGQCLDVSGANDKDVILYPCHGRSNQQFRFAGDGTIRQRGKCLDVAGNVDADGASAIVYPCHNQSNQKWYQDGRAIRSALSGRCLTIKNRRAYTYTCVNSPAQRFDF